MTSQDISPEQIEAVARAIYDAPDTQSGDTVGTVIWNSEHLFYETLDGEEIVDTARRVSMGVCRDAARAAIAAMTPHAIEAGEVERELEALKHDFDRRADFANEMVNEVERLQEALSWAEGHDPWLVDKIRERAALSTQGER